VLCGVSPRALQHVLSLSKVIAFLDGREYVLPEDVKEVAVEALQHRIIRTVHAEAEQITGADLIKEILDYVSIP
jgi:MoxR-like ATPase